MGIRGIYTGVCLECKMPVFPKQSGLATWPRDWLSCKFKLRANCLVSLWLLSCNATASLTLQLLCMFHMCVSFGDLPTVSQLRDLVTRPCWVAHSWVFLHTLSHTTLTWFSPKYRVSKCWITSKLTRNKAKKMIN